MGSEMCIRDRNKRKPNRSGKDKEERCVSPIWCECVKEYALFSDLVETRGRSSKPEDADTIVDEIWETDMRRFGYYLGLLESDQSWIDAGCGREAARREDTRKQVLGELGACLLKFLGGAAAVGGVCVADAFEILFGRGTLEMPCSRIISREEVGT